MNLNSVMDELGAALDTISGLHVYPYPPGSVTAPAAIVAYPDELTFDETYGRGSDRLTVPLLIAVGKVVDRSTRRRLAGYCDGTGADSVKQVVESHTYTSCDTVRVMSVDFDVLQIGAVDYAAALFDVDIYGSGSS